jgi:hypothetical protein
MAAVNEVERLVGIVDVHDVHSDIGAGRVLVGGEIPHSELCSEMALETRFGRHVQHIPVPAIEES